MTIALVYATGPETLFGVGQVEHDEGTVRGSMPTGSPLVGPDGRPSVGALGVLVDNVLGYSIIDSLELGIWSVSTEIWLHLLAPLPTDGGRIRSLGAEPSNAARSPAGRSSTTGASCSRRAASAAGLSTVLPSTRRTSRRSSCLPPSATCRSSSGCAPMTRPWP